MASQTKNAILHNHQGNTLLNSPAPAPMLRNANDFSADEIFAPLDERIITAATEALEAGQTHYVDVPGIAPLRVAIAEMLNESHGGNYAQGNIIVTAGMQESRFLTIQMIGEQFDSIGIPEVAHPGVKRALGVRPMTMHSMAVDERMLVTEASIRSALEAGTSLLYLESPSRSTGAAYSADEVASIAALLTEFKAAAIWDQGLAPWASDYTSLASHQALKDQIAVIGEAWPGAGLSSWYIAYLAAPEAWIPPMQSQKQIMAICTSTASQYAALEASKIHAEQHGHNQSRLKEMRQAISAAAESAGLTALPGNAANILALRSVNADKAALMTKLSQAGFSFSDGAEFGAADLIRLSLSPNADSDSLIASLKS